MNNSCVVIPYIKNTEGKVVKSILYEDILNYTKDRLVAKQIYKDSQDSALLEEHLDYLNYDENGEITLESVLKITKVDVEKQKVLNHLNSQVGNSEMVYSDAVPKLLNFNLRSPFRDLYMAILIPLDKGKYKIHIIENNDENKQLLYDEVFNSSLQNRLIYRLAEAGCSVKFLNEAAYEGRYSTKNALKTAEGFYNLISVLNGETVDSTLLEESGHFILGSLGNTPLVERLLTLMTEDLLKKVLGNDYSSKVLGNNSQRETAGVLIGQALQKTYDNKDNSTIKTLIDRIINFSKKLFAKITRDLLALDIIEAREIAESIAEDFLFKDFTGTAETALETQETLFNKKYSETLKLLNNLTLNLKTLSNNLKSINKKLHKEIDSVYTFAEQARGFSDLEAIGDAFTASCIVSILQRLLSILEYDISDLLAKTNVINNTTLNLVSNGVQLLTVRTYVKSIIQIYDLVQGGIKNLPHNEGPILTIPITNAQGQLENIDLQKMLNDLSSYVRSVVTRLQTKEEQHFLNFLESTYGSKYVTRCARMVFSKKYVRGERAKDMERIKSLKGLQRFLETRIKQVDETTIPISEYLHYLERDCSFLDKWLWSSRKNKDVIVAITKKSIEQSASYANRIMEEDLESVLNLESRYKELQKEGKAPKMSDFYERYSDTNEFTSNYLDARNYGEWERKYKEFKENRKKEFLKQYPENNTLPDPVKAAAFHEWFAPKHKQWHKNNSEYIENPKDKLLRMRVPKLELYRNNAYYEFERKYPEAAQLLQEIKALKVSMDTRLEQGSTTSQRAPLFYGTTINRFRNNRESYSFLKAAKKTLRLSFELVSEDMTDDMFGSDNTYNSTSDMIYLNAIQFNNDQINRLTAFGILPLKDTKKMSTDLFGTLLMYSNMSSKYFANSLIVNTLEVGREVLSRRRVEGNLTEEERKDNTSRAYNSYCKELDLRFYKKSGLGIHLSKSIVYRNIIKICNSIARTLFLGGNVAGAITNVGTGSIEMFKEAVAGEFFSLNTFNKAVLIYAKLLPKHLLESGKDFKKGKLDLFAQHFDVLDDNTKNFNNHHSERNRALNMLLDLAFMPYSLGEHYMQMVPYIAMGLETSLYQIVEEANGNIKTVETNVWDVYTESIEDNKIKLHNKYLKSKKDLKEYKLLKSIYSKIDTVEVKRSVEEYKKRAEDLGISFSPSIGFTQEELDYIDNNKINPWSLLDYIPNKMHLMLWDSSRGSKDESDFQWKCRQVTNQMHGVYNYIDKLAFLNTMLGELVMAMRGYATGMLDKRFSGDKFDVDTKTEGSGHLNDALILILSTFTSYGSLTNTALGLFAPVIAGDYVQKRLKDVGFGEHLYKNLRRASMDMAIATVLLMLKLLTGFADDEDDDAPWILGTLHYFSSRLLKEQLAFNSVRGIKDEIGNILGLSPIAFSAFKDITQITILLIGLNFYTPIPKKIPSNRLPLGYTYFYYNSSKDNLYTYGLSKGWTKLKKYIPYYRVWETVGKNPYEAENAFSYTKKIKQ